MRDVRNRRFVATMGFAAVVAVLIGTLAELHVGVEAWWLVALAAFAVLVPACWWLAFVAFERGDVEPYELSDFGGMALLIVLLVPLLYLVDAYLPEAIPDWAAALVTIVVVTPVAFRLYDWLALRVPWIEPRRTDT